LSRNCTTGFDVTEKFSSDKELNMV
jgi:hypothetical protein